MFSAYLYPALLRILRILWRFTRNAAIGLGLVLVLLLWLLRSPWIQNKIVPYAERALESQLGVPVDIGSIDVHLPGKAVFRDVMMRDKQKQPIFSVHELRINLLSFPILKLIASPSLGPNIQINHAEIVQPAAHLYRSRRDSTWNYAFLIPERDSTPSKPTRIRLRLPDVHIKGGVFSMVDSTKSDSVLGMTDRVNFSNLDLRAIKAHASFELGAGMKMTGKLSKLSVIEERCRQMVQELASDYTIEPKGSSTGGLRICSDNTRLRTARTQLFFDGGLSDESPDTVPGFAPSFTANILPSVFDFATLNLFLPKPLPMRDPVYLKGYFWGDLNGIYSDSLDLAFYRHTRLRTAIALTDFTSADDLKFQLDIGYGQVSFDELQLFLKVAKIPLRGIASMRGTVVGNLKRIKTRKLKVSYLKDTDLVLDAQIDEYLDEDNLFMKVNFKESFFNFDELKKLVPTMNLPIWMGRFGRCSIDGSFLGGISDFVVNADMGSAFGDVSADLHLTLPPTSRDITYSGKVRTTNLNLEGLNPDIPIPYLNFTGEVIGRGAEWGKVVASIRGKVTDSKFATFHINSIETNGLRVNGDSINGGLKLIDPQGSCSATVSLFLPEKKPKLFIVNGNLDSIDLAHYKIFEQDSIFLTSIIGMKIGGDSLENFTGKFGLSLIKLTRRRTDDSLFINKALVISKIDSSGNHKLVFDSDVVNNTLRGSFSYDNAIRLVKRLKEETQLYIKNDDSLTIDYYRKKILVPENVLIKDTLVTTEKLNDVFAFFHFPLRLADSSKVFASFEHDDYDNVEITFVTDSLRYASVLTQQDSMKLTFMKQAKNQDLIGVGYLHLDSLEIGESVRFCDVLFEPSASTDELDCFLRARQSDRPNEVVLSTATRFLDSGEIITTISPGESHLGPKGKYWTFAPRNAIKRRYEHPPSLGSLYPDSTTSRFHVENLTLANGKQRITLDGVVSTDPRDTLKCFVNDVQIRSIAEIFSTDTVFGGTISNTKVLAWNLLGKQPMVYSGGFVNDFHYKEIDSIGIRFMGGWPTINNKSAVGLLASIGHWKQDSLNIRGSYDFERDVLDFSADSSSLVMAWAQPFVEGILSDIHGRVAIDKFTVKGSIKKPLLNGRARLSGAQLKVNFLNNIFKLDDNTIVFDNEKIVIPRVTVSDTAKGSAIVSGEIYYNDTAGVRLDIKVREIDDFLFMDTRKGQNDVFYGHLVLDGDSAEITGYMEQPLVEAWVKTGDNSTLNIPLSTYTSASRLDFVSFVVGGKAIGEVQTEKESPFLLALHVTARPNARIRLIFDEFIGDLIEARGDGILDIFMDENGDMTMFGEYNVTDGNYHFTMENLLNKEFVVKEGGKIRWTGSPFDAELDVTAIYQIKADISALVPGTPSSARIPVDIVMNMRGNLYHPDINLSLALDKLTGQDVQSLDSYFRGITYDQQELNKQVVSLLMFQRFTGASGGVQGAASTVNVTSSISELVSNQVNYWIAQAFEDPNLGVEVKSNQFKDIELALSASLFDDKVTIERNGTILGNSGNSFSLGDISVIIKLLPIVDSLTPANPNAGQLVMEIFNREDAGITSRNNTSQGAGLFFKKDFDRVKDLVKDRNRRKKEDDLDN